MKAKLLKLISRIMFSMTTRFALLTSTTPFPFQSLSVLLLLCSVSLATAFDLPELTAGIFGNSYIFKDHKIKLDPSKAYRDRPGYQVRDSDGFTEELISC